MCVGSRMSQSVAPKQETYSLHFHTPTDANSNVASLAHKKHALRVYTNATHIVLGNLQFKHVILSRFICLNERILLAMWRQAPH